MFYRTRSFLVVSGILAVSILTSLSSFAQKRETIQAQVFGTSTMAGRNFGITILINGYSTASDQKALIDAFNSGGHDAMVKVLSKMKSKGRVRLSSGGVGYEIAYIRNISTPTGRTIRLMTDRPINIGEAMFSTRSKDYDLSLIELHLSSAKNKSTGSLVIGGRFRVSKKKQQIEFESFEAAPWRLAGIMER
jgi:hypothetical protein